MKNKLGFALCLLLAAVFTGCKEDEEGKHHFSNQVFISATSFTDDVFIKRDNLDVTREESCDVTVAMAQPRERDITVTFAEAPGLLEHYRMFYDDPTAELLPANGGYYDFADISTVITAGMASARRPDARRASTWHGASARATRSAPMSSSSGAAVPRPSPISA